MTAIDFIKKFGWEYTVNYADYAVNVNDLKQYVDAWDLVQSIGGLEFAKNFIEQTGSTMDSVLEEAIALVEGVENENN